MMLHFLQYVIYFNVFLHFYILMLASFYRQVMSQKRFETIIRAMRFDEYETREDRQAENR